MLLPSGLREAISKVRSSVAYAVSAIAHWDWPEAWPQLLTLLMEMLVSGNVNAVHGAMRVLTGMEYYKHKHTKSVHQQPPQHEILVFRTFIFYHNVFVLYKYDPSI